MNIQKKERYATMYMNIAKEVAKMSYCNRLKVGSIIVKEGRIISMGWNGMPAGFPNKCEFEHEDKTKPEVIHSESNAISKLAKSPESGENSEMYCTALPCINCAKLIVQAGIKELWYSEDYGHTDGKDFLIKCGVNVIKI